MYHNACPAPAGARRPVVGDAFGECFFAIGTSPYAWRQHLDNRQPPPGRSWRYTDDTEMAMAIVDVLDRHGAIDQDDLAAAFARRYARDDRRGYGGMAHRILQEIGAGRPWREAAASVRRRRLAGQRRRDARRAARRVLRRRTWPSWSNRRAARPR